MENGVVLSITDPGGADQIRADFLEITSSNARVQRTFYSCSTRLSRLTHYWTTARQCGTQKNWSRGNKMCFGKSTAEMPVRGNLPGSRVCV
jgi:hypothetical protein